MAAAGTGAAVGAGMGVGVVAGIALAPPLDPVPYAPEAPDAPAVAGAGWGVVAAGPGLPEHAAATATRPRLRILDTGGITRMKASPLGK